MKAVYFDGSNLLFKKFKEPYAAADQVKIRFELGGICSTDLEILKGYGDFIGVLGHEVVGTVVSAPGKPELVSKKVVFDINIGCNKPGCSLCSRGLQKHCFKRRAVGINGYSGGFSEYFILPMQNVVEIPDELMPKKAVFAEPLAAAMEPLDRDLIKKTDEITVFGVGKLGTLAMLGLHAKGYNVIGVVRTDEHKEFLESRFPQLKLIKAEKVVGRFDVVYESAGSTSIYARLLNYVKPQGTLIIKSTLSEYKTDKNSNERQIIPALNTYDINNIVVNEIKVIGSRCGNIKAAVDLLAEGKFDPTSLISYEFPLDQAGVAFKKAANNPGKKVLLYQSTVDEIV